MYGLCVNHILIRENAQLPKGACGMQELPWLQSTMEKTCGGKLCWEVQGKASGEWSCCMWELQPEFPVAQWALLSSRGRKYHRMCCTVVSPWDFGAAVEQWGQIQQRWTFNPWWRRKVNEEERWQWSQSPQPWVCPFAEFHDKYNQIWMASLGLEPGGGCAVWTKMLEILSNQINYCHLKTEHFVGYFLKYLSSYLTFMLEQIYVNIYETPLGFCAIISCNWRGVWSCKL